MKWEEVTENTWRLELEDGYLYRFGSSMVYVPPDIGSCLYDISQTLEVLKDLFEETTFEVSGKEGIRAIRNCDIGD